MPELAMTSRGRSRMLGFLAAIFLLACGPFSAPAAAQQVVVFVNGAPITTYDVDQRIRFLQMTSQKVPTRQEVIEDLINEKVKVQEAQRYNLDASDADVERGVANMANGARLSMAEFKKVLAGHGVELGTVKSKIRSDMAWTQLVRARFPATLQIEESEIRDALAAKENSGIAYDYILRPIVFIVPKGAAAAVVEGRVREAEGLRSRFENCTDGVNFARALKDVAVRDLVKRTSADLSPALRDILDNTSIGKLTKPEVTGQGVEVFALCEKNENKSDTPERRLARQQLFISRFEAQSKRYLNDVRRGSMIEYK